MKNLASGMLAVLLALPGSGIMANAVIESRMLEVDPYSVGSTVTMQLRVASNTTTAPTVFAFRITYEGESARFLSVSPGWAGTALSGPATAVGSTTKRYVDVVGFSFGNTNRTPTLANLRFVIGNSLNSNLPQSPFSITVADNPNTSLTLADNLDVVIPHTFSTDLTSQLRINGANDLDQDGVADSQEATLGTDPLKRDTDGDGIEDGVEVAVGTNPTVANVFVDGDGDGLPLPFDGDDGDPDQDDDRISDGYEVAFGFDETISGSTPPLGDVTGNGSMDLADGLGILRVVVGRQEANSLAATRNWDVNRDGFRDNVDGILIINQFLGNLPCLPQPRQ